MLTEKTISTLKEKGYSSEEIIDISNGLEDIKNGDFIDFEELIKKNYKVNENAYV